MIVLIRSSKVPKGIYLIKACSCINILLLDILLTESVDFACVRIFQCFQNFVIFSDNLQTCKLKKKSMAKSE